MINLLAKDFKLFFGSADNMKKKIFSLIITAIIYVLFIAIEVTLFTLIIDKLKSYNEAPLSFLTLFLFIISCIMIFINITRAYKLLFDKNDTKQLINKPIENAQIILSKLVFMLLTHYITSIIFIYPLFISYGQIMGATVWFYYLGLFYPLLTFLFEIGIALLLLYPFKITLDFLKKHKLVEFILYIVLLFVGCYLYQQILNIFMDLVVNNKLTELLTKENIELLQVASEYFVPINFLVKTFFLKSMNSLVSYILISLGIFIFGVALAIFIFQYFRKIETLSNVKSSKKEVKVRNIRYILLKKELILLFKNSNNTLSYTGLLIIQPFLVYLIISSMNSIFSSGVFGYYMLILPELIPIMDVLIIMLFSVIISSGANEYIQVEKETIRIMKIIPVSPETQLLYKVMVPFVLSCVSLTLTCLVLVISGVISFTTFIFAFVITLMLLVIYDIVSLAEELKIRHSKPRGQFLSNLYSYLLPLVFFVVTILLSYFGAHILVSYLLAIVILAGIMVPHIMSLRKNTLELFKDLEVVN